MGKKIIISHKEVDVKVFLEVLAVYIILAFILIAILYLQPRVTGFAVLEDKHEYDAEAVLELNDGEGVMIATFSLAVILIVILLVYRVIHTRGENLVKSLMKESSKKSVKKQAESIGEEKQEADLEELKKSIKNLSGIFEKKQEERGKIVKKRKGKSRKFIKCHELLLKTEQALQKNDFSTAKELYVKTRDLYTNLEYLERKEIYKELTDLYKSLSK